MKLENKTVIFPHDPQRRYVIELDLFHQLHCLVNPPVPFNSTTHVLSCLQIANTSNRMTFVKQRDLTTTSQILQSK